MAKETRATSSEVGIASKMAQARERMSAEVKVLGDMIQREIVEAREWPPPPEIAADIKKRSFALGARSVKLLEAVDKLESLRARLEDENTRLSEQVHDLRMKSSGISPAELMHLQMENKVLKEHVSQLEEAIAVGSDAGALEAENARLLAQLKELEREVERLLKESADADEAKEENLSLLKEAEDLKAEVEALKTGGARKPSSGSSFLASVWDAASPDEGAEKDPRVASLTARISDLEAENQEMMEKARRKLESVSRERDQLAVKVAELAESAALRAEQAIQEINELREERARLAEDLEQAHSAGGRAAAGEDRAVRIKSLETEAETLRQELENARRGENEIITELRSEMERIREAGKASADEPAEVRAEDQADIARAEFASEMNFLRNEAESLKKRIEDLDAEKRDMVSNLENASAAAQGRSRETDDLEERAALLQRELAGARSAVATAAEESDHLRAEVKNLFQEWVRVEAVARELRVERDDLETRLASAQADLDSLRSGPAAGAADGSIGAEDIRKVVASLEKYIGELESELDKREAELEEMKIARESGAH